MIHIIWSILNLGIILYFFYIIIEFLRKGKQIFNSKLKFITIGVMILGILQIVSLSQHEESNNKIVLVENYNINNISKIKKIVLEKDLFHNYNLYIKYTVNQNEIIPIESSCTLTGFISGFNWELKSIKASKIENNKKADYVVKGVLEWNLFGFNVYNQHKTFTGQI